jgi:TPR repeat protein
MLNCGPHRPKGLEVASNMESARFLIESRMRDAAGGDAQARYDLGVAYSCGTGGVGVDLVEAHKWFNLAALAGSEEGQNCRAEISEEMTAREIAEAQRIARSWLSQTAGRAAA